MLFYMSLVRNKKATFNFELLEKYEAGLDLLGQEVKALKAGKAQLDGSRVLVRGGEAYLVGATISPYQVANTTKNYEPTRPRRLLLKKKEILELLHAESTKGLTVVPISVYNKGNLVKLEIAIARGKKKEDKRESIKKKDTARDIARETKTKLR